MTLVAESYYRRFWSPLATVTLNPNSNQQAPDATSFFFPVMDAYRKQLGLENTFRQPRTLVLQQIKERGALPRLIVVISVRQSTVAAISGLYSLALVGQPGAYWQPDCKFRQRAERSERLRTAGSRLFLLWLSASSSACHGLLIITVITPLPTKPSATKTPENWSWRTRQLLTCRCVSVMLLLDAKYTKELADAKARNDALRDDVAAGRRRLHYQQPVSRVKPPPPPAWIMQPPPTGRQSLNGLFHPRERLITMQKQSANPEVY